MKDQDIVDLVKESFDLEDAYKLEQNAIHTKPNKDRLDMQRLKHIDQSLGEITRARDDMFLNNPGLDKAFANKYRHGPVAPEQAGADEPGLLSRILGGVKDTAKFVIQNPLQAGRHVDKGVKDFATMPFRALESVTTGGGKWPIASFKQAQEEDTARLAAQDKAAGVDPRGTGPMVTESLGSAALPVGPTLKAGQWLKNIAKSAGFTGGAYAGERVAEGEPVDDEGLGASAGIGGSLGALFSLLTRGKAKPGAPMREPLPESHQLEHKPALVTPEPMKRLPAPEAETPSHFKNMMESLKTKSTTGEPLTDEEKRFLMWFKEQKQTPPPNVSGEKTDTRPLATMVKPKEAPSVTPTAEAKPAAAGVPGKVPAPAGALSTLLKKEPTPAPSAIPEAAAGIEAEKAARVAAGKTPDNKPIIRAGRPEASAEVKPTPKPNGGAGATIAPKDLISTMKSMEAAETQAAKEATLGDVVSGKLNVKDVPVKRGGKPPKSEAPAPTVEGEVGATPKIQDLKTMPPARSGKIAQPKPVKPSQAIDFFGERGPSKADTLAERLIKEGKPPEKAIELAEFKTEQKVSPEVKTKLTPPLKQERLEGFIQAKGYRLEEKEPFPGEKSYNVVDPKTGNTIARGDRGAILNALNTQNEGKGIKLYSFPGDVGELATMLGDKLKAKSGVLPKDTTVSNSPHREGIVHYGLRSLGLETPQFAMRKSASGTKVVNAALDAEDLIKTRVNDLMYRHKGAPGKETYEPTNLFRYFSMDAKARQKVNDVLVLGDKTETVYTDAELLKHGLTLDQVAAYRGVRESLDDVVKWVKELGGDASEFDARKITGYIPRVWKGNWEIFVDGVKHVPSKSGRETGSAFATLTEAAEEAHRIKAASPGSKLDIKFFADPDYLPGRGILDARAVARVKKNLETMGKLDSKAIDEAFKMGRSVSGFAKHLLERKDATGYETEDLDKVLFSYFNQAARKVEFKKVRQVVEDVVKDHKKDLTGAQVDYLKEYVERVAGKPAWDQLAFEQFIKNTPIGKWVDPVASSVGLKSLNDYVTYKSLGFGNVSWALINLDTLTRHVWPMLQNEAKGMGNPLASEKYLFEGVKSFFQDKGLRQKLAHNGVIDIQMMSESRPDIGHTFGKGKWTPERVIMFLGLQTEEFVRGVGAIARYKMALDQGMGDSDAMRTASRFVAETAARYSKAGKAPIFTSATGATLGKFKPYLGVMLQNMYKALESKDMGVVTRYMLASLGVGGIIGAIPGAEDVDDAMTKLTGFSPIQWAYQHIPEGILTGAASVAPGAVGLPNVDLSRKAGLPDVFPDDVKGWAGPVLNTYAQALIDASQGEGKEALRDLMPTSLRNVLAVTDKPGYVVGRHDKPSVELGGKGEQIARGLGFQSPSEVRSLRDYKYVDTLANRRETELQRLTRKIHSDQASDADRDRFAELGGTARRVREESRRQSLTSRERQERHLPKILRQSVPSE